jgi:DNA-binding CsgD family transcriptional regulator
VSASHAPVAGGLGQRQIEVLELVADGLTGDQIGDRLGISRHTVKGHMRTILRTLGVVNAAAAVSEGYQRGILHRSAAVVDDESAVIPAAAYQGLVRVARLLVEGQPRVARTLAGRLLAPGGALRVAIPAPRRSPAPESQD